MPSEGCYVIFELKASCFHLFVKVKRKAKIKNLTLKLKCESDKKKTQYTREPRGQSLSQQMIARQDSITKTNMKHKKV